MPTEKQFRGILLASFVLGIAGAFLDVVAPTLIPQPLVDASGSLQDSESQLSMVGLTVAGCVLIVGGLISLYGLWFFRRWAPRWALGITVLTYLVYPFFGHTLVSALAATFTDISTLLWGAVLAMAFLPPLKERFVA